MCGLNKTVADSEAIDSTQCVVSTNTHKTVADSEAVDSTQCVVSTASVQSHIKIDSAQYHQHQVTRF